MADSNIFSGPFSGGGTGTLTAAAIIAALGYTPAVAGDPSFYDFTLGTLPSGVSFTRASSGWRYNSAGLLVSETTDAPRFQYDPAALTPRGLLIEDAATNNFQRSAEFDNAYWGKTNCSVTADAATAPDGTVSMDKLIENSSAGLHNLSRSMSVTSGATYAVEVFVKADTRTWCTIALAATGFGTTLRNYFDVGTGALGSAAAGCTNFIQHVGGGIYRCVVIATATATASANITLELATNGSTVSYTGDGASGLFMWGANIKEIDCVTSNIPTTSAAVTRAADVANVTTGYAIADQCWIVKGRTPRKISGGAVNVAFQVDDGSENNRRTLRYGTDGKLHVIATVGGVDQCDLDLGSVANDTDFAVAIRWADNNFAASLNGGAVVTDVSGSNPIGLTTSRVGRSYSGGYWNSTIRTIKTQSTASDTDLPLLAA